MSKATTIDFSIESETVMDKVLVSHNFLRFRVLEHLTRSYLQISEYKILGDCMVEVG